MKEEMEEELKFDYTLNDLKEMSLIVLNHFKNKEFKKENIDIFVEKELERGHEGFKEIMSNLDGIDKILNDGEKISEIEMDSIGNFFEKIKSI